MVHFVGAGSGAKDLITVREPNCFHRRMSLFMPVPWLTRSCWTMQSPVRSCTTAPT